MNAEGDVGAVFEQVKILFNELTLKATPIVFVLGMYFTVPFTVP